MCRECTQHVWKHLNALSGPAFFPYFEQRACVETDVPAYHTDIRLCKSIRCAWLSLLAVIPRGSPPVLSVVDNKLNAGALYNHCIGLAISLAVHRHARHRCPACKGSRQIGSTSSLAKA